jgi:hypothetical protein
VVVSNRDILLIIRNRFSQIHLSVIRVHLTWIDSHLSMKMPQGETDGFPIDKESLPGRLCDFPGVRGNGLLSGKRHLRRGEWNFCPGNAV